MQAIFDYLQIRFIAGDTLGQRSVSLDQDLVGMSAILLLTLLPLTGAIRLLRQDGLSHAQRTLLASICMGGGIWLAHAAGILVLQADASSSMNTGRILDALVISICGSLLAFGVLGDLRLPISPVRLISSGTLLGLTMTLVHQGAISALNTPGTLMFVPDLWIYAQLIAVAATTVGIALLVYQAAQPQRHAQGRSGVAPALLVLTAILGQHFTGITSMRLFSETAIDTSSGWQNRDALHAIFAGVLLTSGLAFLIGSILNRRTGDASSLGDSGGYRLEHLMESVPDSVLVVARSGAVQQMNRAALELFDVDPDGAQSLNARTLIPDAAAYIEGETMTSGAQRYLELDGRTVGGREVPLEVSVSELQDSHGDFFVLVARDISVRRRVEQHIRNLLEENKRLATTDTLTGLPNRRHILDTVGKEISRCARHGHALSVLMIDIDYFKRINDTHGHAAGDQALREMAEVVRSVARSSDLVSRFGGEEFLLVLTETGLVQARLVAERLREQVGLTPIMTDRGDCFSMTISVGVSEWASGALFEDVVAQADRALYNAKATGRNRVVVYSNQLPAVPTDTDSA